eukprot:scaffold2641_cov110-Skeletonema_dohrnii-CCMP3373.AAC.3
MAQSKPHGCQMATGHADWSARLNLSDYMSTAAAKAKEIVKKPDEADAPLAVPSAHKVKLQIRINHPFAVTLWLHLHLETSGDLVIAFHLTLLCSSDARTGTGWHNSICWSYRGYRS